MGAEKFLTVFSQILFSDRLLYTLKDAQIDNIVLDTATNSMSFELNCDCAADTDILDEISDIIAAELKLSDVLIKVKSTSDLFDDSSFSSLLEILQTRHQRARMLKGAKWTLEKNALSIFPSVNCTDWLSECSAIVESIMLNDFNIKVSCKIIDPILSDDSAVEKYEKEKQQRMQELILESSIQQKSSTTASDKPASSVLFGSAIKGAPRPMAEITLETGKSVIEGDVFSVRKNELKNRNSWILSFDISDFTDSITVHMFLRANKFGGNSAKSRNMDMAGINALLAAIQPGMHLVVQGKMVINQFNDKQVFEPDSICVAPKKEREDTAERKRVELHLHTKMSAVDGITDVKSAIRQADKWGHPAIAITDHGVVQAFPDAMAAKKGLNIKVIYGCEAYMSTGDPSEMNAVKGSAVTPLDDEFIVFDLETTGLNPRSDKIIEIAAILIKDCIAIDSFHTMVDPQTAIPPKITEITGITGADVKGAPVIDDALAAFLDFVGDRPLIAHNADFDMGFVRESCRQLGIARTFTSVDTVALARALMPGLNNYKLNTVAKAVGFTDFRHHRAMDDTRALVEIVSYLFRSMIEIDRLKSVDQINTSSIQRGQRKSFSRSDLRHIIVLAKSYVGLRNLYELISISHTKYFHYCPTIPKSLLKQHREGLILGSACENGELFRAIVAGQPWESLIDIAKFYDYLEIQPLTNNEYLIRNGRAADFEQLREFNRTVVKLGETLGKPVCATCDVHYLNEQEEIFRRIIKDANKLIDADTQPVLHFRTTNEMLDEFAYLGAEKAMEVVVDNPNMIADMCEDIQPIKSGTYSPEIPNSANELENLVSQKATVLYGENIPELIRERIAAEMNSIIGQHFDGIYIIAQKLVARSLAEGYLVGSRGSVGSSVAAFLSGITEVNALPPHYLCPECKYCDFDAAGMACGPDLPDRTCPECGSELCKEGFDIPFATFLGFKGEKKPDIDLNFSGEYQGRAHRHTIEIFGEDKVFRAGTISTIAENTAFGYVKKYLEKRSITVSSAEENRLASGCVGVKRTTGQHPGGLIIVPESNDINEFCPIQHPADKKDSGVITTHFDYHSIEENLLKLDLLGHDDPTMIRMLSDLTGIDARTIRLDDKDTMRIFISSAPLGFEDDPILGPTGACAVPEFGTRFVREMLRETSPKTFDELLRISGLSHGTDVWLGNARDLIVGGTATLKDVICTRDDIMLYLISKGLDSQLAFNISENVRKGKGLKPEWLPEMSACGVPQWYMDSCKKIKYMFPKAHAAAYVMMAFRIAWFKVHYPKEFYCAWFTVRAKAFDANLMTGGIDSLRTNIQSALREKEQSGKDEDTLNTLEVCYEFRKRGLEFSKIDLYRSDATQFTVTDTGLLPPFTSIPGLGEVAANSLVEARNGEKFISVEDLQHRCTKLSKTHIEQMTALGVLDGLPQSGQLSLFDFA